MRATCAPMTTRRDRDARWRARRGRPHGALVASERRTTRQARSTYSLAMRWLAAVMVLVPVVALANGRAPLTNGVHFQPGDNHTLYVATTFGLLISRDDGCSFRWVCEQNLGYGGTFDPKYRIARDGTIFATTYTGLRVSRDGGCSFATATTEAPAGDPGRIAGAWIDAIDI